MKKLYDENAYAREFDAVVTAVAEGDDGASVWLTLDATLFFPEEGGQSPDRGTIDGRTVTDVQIADGEVRHRVNIDPDGAGALYRTGMTVHGIIDWEYRYRNMQMHTGEHIFSGLVHSLYGYDNVGFHLSDRTATMDYNGKLTEQQLLKLEERVNRIITENRAVQAWYPAPGELEILSYRSKKAIDGAVRLAEIDGVDLCACCAPHVKATGEVGCFKLIGWENYKGGVRVSYRCGFRAMEDYGEKLRDERKRLAYELVAKDRAIVRSRIAETAAAETGERAEDGRIAGSCVLFLEAADSSLLRYAVDELKARYAGVVCALLPVEGNALSWRYLIEQDGGDVSAWQQLLRERFGAKGGGPKNSVQGSVTAEETALRSALASL
jgi:alanyl-tRNA synthetase